RPADYESAGLTSPNACPEAQIETAPSRGAQPLGRIKPVRVARRRSDAERRKEASARLYEEEFAALHARLIAASNRCTAVDDAAVRPAEFAADTLPPYYWARARPAAILWFHPCACAEGCSACAHAIPFAHPLVLERLRTQGPAQWGSAEAWAVALAVAAAWEHFGAGAAPGDGGLESRVADLEAELDDLKAERDALLAELADRDDLEPRPPPIPDPPDADLSASAIGGRR
ncbi:MAG: hypothetical protein KC486_34535, partial [Myxococcales bacterium]|nr:hypothetical protein [Myxococcales bacterium]